MKKKMVRLSDLTVMSFITSQEKVLGGAILGDWSDGDQCTGGAACTGGKNCSNGCQ